MLSKSELIELISQQPSQHTRILKSKYRDTYDVIDNGNSDNSLKFIEKLYIYLNGDSGVCGVCGKRCKFESFSIGFRDTCSHQCAAKKTMIPRVVKNCLICNSEFSTIPSRNQRMCSRKCADAYINSEDSKASIKVKRENTLFERYGVTHNTGMPDTINKSRETRLRKYGKWDDIRDKVRQTKIDRYGSVSYYNVDKFRETIRRRNLLSNSKTTPIAKASNFKRVMTRISKQSPDVTPRFTVDEYVNYLWTNTYPFTCNICDLEFTDNVYITNIVQCPVCNPSRSANKSSIETDIADFIKCHYDGDILMNNRELLNGKELDIVLPELGIAIEVNGIYWHTELSGKGKFYHLHKTEQCELIGLQLLHITDGDWNFKRKLVESMILSKLGIITGKIYARKCVVKIITAPECNDFLNVNHIQGQDRSKIRIGTYHNGELVSVMTFGTSRYDSKYEYELHRYCSILNTQVIGAASKMLKHFITHYDPSSILTYSDRQYSNGGLYKKLGFSFVSNTSPNYHYVDDHNVLYSRQKFQKHKLKSVISVFDPLKTEWQNMQDNGYDRIWNCGNTKWELIIKSEDNI